MIASPDVEFMGPAEGVEIMGADGVEIMGFGDPSTVDVVCAEKEKGLVYAAAGCTVGTLGAGLFGVYKLFKGKPAAGVTSLLAAGIVFVLGREFASTAALAFEACTNDSMIIRIGTNANGTPNMITVAQARAQGISEDSIQQYLTIARGSVIPPSNYTASALQPKLP